MKQAGCLCLLFMLVLLCIGCSGTPVSDSVPAHDSTPGHSPPTIDDEIGLAVDDPDSWRIRIINPLGEELWSFSESELSRLPNENAGAFAHAYSTINNWPTSRFYAADGYSVESILLAAGVLEAAQTVTFRAEDGYEVSLTREQLLNPQYFFPNVGERILRVQKIGRAHV